MNLKTLLEEAAEGLPGLAVVDTPGGERTWSHDGVEFAVLNGNGGVEFALDGPVAAAATRTPDVVASPRGAGWVNFRPTVLDDHAADRAAAWFASAHRRLAR